MRRDVLIDGMFLDIASPEEKRKVDELYSRGYKASAVVYQLKRVRAVWVKLLNSKENNNRKCEGSADAAIFHPVAF